MGASLCSNDMSSTCVLAEPLLEASAPHHTCCCSDGVFFLSVLCIASLGLISLALSSLLNSQALTDAKAVQRLMEWPDYERPYHVPSPDMVAHAKIAVAEDGYKREFLYDTAGQVRRDAPMVQCAGWGEADESSKLKLFDEALAKLRSNGYVILEGLVPKDIIHKANDEFRSCKDERVADGMSFNRMRSQRDMTVPPLAGIWVEDQLTRNPLVMKLLAHYVRNSLDAIHHDTAIQVMEKWHRYFGADINFFQENGSYCDARPILDLMVVIDTPPGAPPQVRHRDTFVPGPASSIGVHIPLTPLQLDPLNGAIGFSPGTQRERLEGHNIKREQVGVVPPGSVVLYDSFLEHHGLENDSPSPRCALFSWYRVPGVYSGHSDENFKTPGLKETTRWRRHVEERLLPAILRSRGASCEGAELQWGLPLNSKIVEWGEDRICFKCDRTTGDGSYAAKPGEKNMWFCDDCWADCRAKGDSYAHPQPSPSNSAIHQYEPDEYTDEQMKMLESANVLKASKGRHKLALLRERGHFMPIDPTTKWLNRLARDPQPHLWKRGVRTSLGELGRGADDPRRNVPIDHDLKDRILNNNKERAREKERKRRQGEYNVLPKDAVVIIRGVESRPQLNEKVAFVQDVDPKRQRYIVKLQDSDDTMSLPNDKLQQVVMNARIKQLATQPELNGMECIVFDGEADSGRFMVQVTSQRKVLSLLPENLQLPSGTSVKIIGVQKQPQLNGRRGKIVSFDEGTGRYSVQVDRDEIKQLRPANVRP